MFSDNGLALWCVDLCVFPGSKTVTAKVVCKLPAAMRNLTCRENRRRFTGDGEPAIYILLHTPVKLMPVYRRRRTGDLHTTSQNYCTNSNRIVLNIMGSAHGAKSDSCNCLILQCALVLLLISFSHRRVHTQF